ncbi:DUF2341 domain-containing protein, partial [Candidatus Bathyarchaeota archaeon]|nr:DUF2341 domain-containing protein [Candidatus Bathyarchaeota archaeon]
MIKTLQNNRFRTAFLHICLSLLILNMIDAYAFGFDTFAKGQESPSEWLSGWQYRKEHNITLFLSTENNFFYALSDPWITISGNPTDRHDFQPVHTTTIVEINTIVDGATRKYLAYDSDSAGSRIRLYYADDINGSWTAYSGNPILGPSAYHYRWPSVAPVNGTFQMFLTDLTDGALERWTSIDGINYEFAENVKVGGNQWKNPFIWLNPNDNRWYLYSHDSSGGIEYIKVRSAVSIEDLSKQSDVIVFGRAGFLGSPTVTYSGGQYWLLAEILDGGVWKTIAYYSTTSPISGFKECKNSPVMTDDEACPMLFLTSDQTQAYLFSDKGNSIWHQLTRSVYLNATNAQSSEKVTDYQMRITAHFGNGADSGEDVYLNGHARTDFGDVRFMWLNSSTGSEVECYYWVETLKTGDSAQFWVKIPEISSGNIAGGTNNTVYVYYGNNEAVTASNRDATLDFYDDFNGNLSKWTVLGGTWQIQDGELSAETTSFGQRIRANGFTFGNNSVHVKIEWISGTYFENGPYVRGQPPNEQYNGYVTFLSTWGGDLRHRISKMSGSTETTFAGQGTVNPSKNVWYSCVFSLFGNTLKSIIGPLYASEIVGADSGFKSGTLCLFSWSASSENVYFDDLFVTKYLDPEPGHGGWGSETASNFVTIDQTFMSAARTDVGSPQTVGFHAKWANNGSDVSAGTVYVNGTEYTTNDTGWLSFTANSPVPESRKWLVTGVNCGGVTTYAQTAPSPSIIWDQIRLSDGGVTKESVTVGETAIVWFKAYYEYNGQVFNGTEGTLYVDGSEATWSAA